MDNKKILVVCHLTDSKSNGQIAKTKDTINFIEKNGFDVDVFNYGKHGLLSSICCYIFKLHKYKKVVILPGGKRALFLFTRLFTLRKKTNINYVAVGGWVLGLLTCGKYNRHFNRMKRFKGIYLQNNRAVEEFKNHGFNNVYMVSNFSNKKLLSDDEFKRSVKNFESNDSYNFVFFARVFKDKGVFLACDAINKARKELTDINISLDIYGEIKDDEAKHELQKYLGEEHIKYKGVLDSENAIKELSNYYCMLFPTFYRGEGTPHSIIESFMAGLPVIASNWAYNSEIVENKKTGLLFELNTDQLFDSIVWSIKNKEAIKEMKSCCFNQSKKYDINFLLKPLIDKLSN